MAALRDNASAADACAREALKFIELASQAPHGVKPDELDKLRRRLDQVCPEKTSPRQ
ncbi:MAG: hypothetical protein U5L06_01670 [Rhodovibrio sp.]|nr:hypothetical protein [Rhodovibrio sp.]